MFVKKYFAMAKHDDRLHFFQRTPQVDMDGRKVIIAWLTTNWGRWNIYGIFDEAMEAHGRGLYTIAGIAGNQVS